MLLRIWRHQPIFDLWSSHPESKLSYWTRPISQPVLRLSKLITPKRIITASSFIIRILLHRKVSNYRSAACWVPRRWRHSPESRLSYLPLLRRHVLSWMHATATTQRLHSMFLDVGTWLSWTFSHLWASLGRYPYRVDLFLGWAILSKKRGKQRA